MKRILTVLALIFVVRILICSEIKAVWVPIWEINSAKKIDRLINDLEANNINEMLVEVRYRGDALYFPNKFDSTYINNEKLSYVLNKKNFDPLAYLIENSQNIRVKAWVTTFVVTPHDLSYLDSSHVYFKHKNWITCDFTGRIMDYNSYEGAYLDPGLPEVKDYLKHVFLDIVSNYEIDGLHLDYIRYPDIEFGYNPAARKKYMLEVDNHTPRNWQLWREQQVSDFVKDLNSQLKGIKPDMELSAAVISELSKARYRYAQNWLNWLENQFIDRVYLMAYTKNDRNFETMIDSVADFQLQDKIVIGVRAWDSQKTYSVQLIQNKINYVKKKELSGFAFYSYTGIKQNNYVPGLKKVLR